VKSGCFVHCHSADEIFGQRFRLFHGHAPFMPNIHLAGE
jgi:hypothetical protein